MSLIFCIEKYPLKGWSDGVFSLWNMVRGLVYTSKALTNPEIRVGHQISCSPATTHKPHSQGSLLATPHMDRCLHPAPPIGPMSIGTNSTIGKCKNIGGGRWYRVVSPKCGPSAPQSRTQKILLAASTSNIESLTMVRDNQLPRTGGGRRSPLSACFCLRAAFPTPAVWTRKTS